METFQACSGIGLPEPVKLFRAFLFIGKVFEQLHVLGRGLYPYIQLVVLCWGKGMVDKARYEVGDPLGLFQLVVQGMFLVFHAGNLRIMGKMNNRVVFTRSGKETG